jgi:hypothetical protein
MALLKVQTKILDIIEDLYSEQCDQNEIAFVETLQTAYDMGRAEGAAEAAKIYGAARAGVSPQRLFHGTK